MKRLGSLLVLTLLITLLPAGPTLAQSPLRAETSHVLVVPPVFDGDHMLAWQGPISGDINGWIEWWIDTTTWTTFPEPTNPAQASHYTMTTKIYDAPGGTLILETLEHGTTTTANWTWRANGVVLYADPILFPGWEGRRVHESGETNTDVFPWTGTSDFRLN